MTSFADFRINMNNYWLQSKPVRFCENANSYSGKSDPRFISGTKDLIALHKPGTGKTAAFGLPLLQLINANDKFPQALIVCPTRELCIQIVK